MAGGTLSGRYEIGDRLGSGGMSNVYKATDLTLERTVAVKILAEHLSDDDRFVARFRREALAVAKLVHPNIVQVYDTGVDDARHYIVMEYVEGRSGAQILQRQGPIGPETAAEVGAQACAGLDYAHRRGIIHRDVKPGNLMIVGGPVGGGEMTVKLTDFGIARALAQTRITQVGSVVGTAAYLAPEQVRGEEATPATDVYALGVVLYQFLTGRLPYEGSTLAELAVRQQNERPSPLHLQRRGAGAARRGGPAGAGGRPLAPLRQRRRTGRRPASRPAGRGRDAAARRGGDPDQRDGRRDGDPPPRRRHGPDRVPAGAVADQAPDGAPAGPAAGPDAPAPAQAARRPAKRGAFSRFVRLMLALVGLVLIAAAVATAVIVTTDKATGVRATEIAGDTVHKVVEEFKDAISKNKRMQRRIERAPRSGEGRASGEDLRCGTRRTRRRRSPRGRRRPGRACR